MREEDIKFNPKNNASIRSAMKKIEKILNGRKINKL